MLACLKELILHIYSALLAEKAASISVTPFQEVL